MKRKLALFGVILAALFMGGCATYDINLTHEQGYLWAAGVYLGQYNLYLDQVLKKDLPVETKALVKKDITKLTNDMLRTDLTDSEKTTLRKKKAILVKVWPLLRVWGTYVRTGVLTPGADYQTIDQLESLAIGLVTNLAKEGN